MHICTIYRGKNVALFLFGHSLYASSSVRTSSILCESTSSCCCMSIISRDQFPVENSAKFDAAFR